MKISSVPLLAYKPMHEHMTKLLDSGKDTGIKGRTKDSEGDGGLDAGREEPVGGAD